MSLQDNTFLCKYAKHIIVSINWYYFKDLIFAKILPTIVILLHIIGIIPLSEYTSRTNYITINFMKHY